MMTYNVTSKGEISMVTLAGVIDEQSDFSSLLEEVVGDVEVSLDEVRRVNSSGLLRWLSFVHGVNDRGGMITLKGCRPHFVEQLNMVYQLAGNQGQVASFYVPYVCEKCDVETEILLRAGEVRGRWAPKRNCPTCAQFLSFENGENYFQFLYAETTGYVELNLDAVISTADASTPASLLRFTLSGGVASVPEGFCKRGESAFLAMADRSSEAASLRATVGHVSAPVKGVSRVDLVWELAGEANLQRFQGSIQSTPSNSPESSTMSVLARSPAHRDFIVAELAKGELMVQCSDVVPLDADTMLAIITEDGTEMPPLVEDVGARIVSVSRAKDGRVFVGLIEKSTYRE
tara:strand:+ start:11423 stop:12460 length:1038 start_codon:yes stop_codon:yes gene_type:complete